MRDSKGEYFLIYYDDVYPNSKDWIKRLMDVFQLPNVGAVLPALKYEDETIQHAGMITGIGIIWPGITGKYQRTASAEGYMLFNATPLNMSEKDQKWTGILNGKGCMRL